MKKLNSRLHVESTLAFYELGRWLFLFFFLSFLSKRMLLYSRLLGVRRGEEAGGVFGRWGRFLGGWMDEWMDSGFLGVEAEVWRWRQVGLWGRN